MASHESIKAFWKARRAGLMAEETTTAPFPPGETPAGPEQAAKEEFPDELHRYRWQEIRTTRKIPIGGPFHDS